MPGTRFRNERGPVTPPDAGGEAVTCRGLRKSFGVLTVLDDVDLTVAHGEVVCVIGPSGSGKSTLLRCLNGLERPDAGELRVLGVDLFGRERDLVGLRRRVGMVFQQFNLFPHRRVIENVAEGPRHVLKVSRAESREIATEQLLRVGLGDKLEEVPSRLSGGQQQRVAIARALAMRPEMMLFDECTSALDPELVGEVLTVMRALAEEGMTMVVVSHEMQFARRVADRVVMLGDGAVVEQGPAAEFFDNPRSERTKRFLRRLAWVDDEAEAGA